jgi:hypothetical protein
MSKFEKRWSVVNWKDHLLMDRRISLAGGDRERREEPISLRLPLSTLFYDIHN